MPKDAPEVETELPDSQPQRQGGPWPLIVVVVVVTLIAVWLVPGEDTEDDPVAEAPEPPSLLQESATPSAAITTDEKPAEPETTIETAVLDDRPGARARALIAEMRASGALSLDDIFAAAIASQEAEEWADAYLLYFFAAREGHDGAALTLARQADPEYHSTGASVFEAPDLLQAHKWYETAATQGNEDAKVSLADLRSRVDRLAADGDPEAQRIALQWQ